jgi:hypothetical protein
VKREIRDYVTRIIIDTSCHVELTSKGFPNDLEITSQSFCGRSAGILPFATLVSILKWIMMNVNEPF